ncbi:potassium/sodium hyperpolarization-activated cyclic nucleotide-gated channel 3-like [Anoplophora glabripennis]|uniref:potassium/sodium hyperpolarization-activated cyclic nucleotide-gated channel 3-like n=1 Tax=Anoplophora glabripennis TaxID=217634 RepID=UPI000C75F30A|nr:potassium/sodium hyperpolarization-activated cyclic nucleotide-gated channel 3-like [Anoplophora glabripennis]
MSKYQHKCNLHVQDDYGLPKLAPNAHWTKKLGRVLRKLVLINPNHPKCKSLFRSKSVILRERKIHTSGPNFFVIHPLSTLNAILNATFVILWLYLMVMEPLMIFMAMTKYIENVHRIVLTPVQLVLILLFFNRGYIDKKTNQIVLEFKKIIRRYLFTYFIFDYLSTYFAIDIPARWILQSDKEKEGAERLAYSLRIFAYSIRIHTLIEFMDHSLRNIKLNKTLRSLSCYTIKTYLILHLFTNVIVAVPYLWYVYTNEYSPRSWLMTTGIFFKQKLYQRYFETFRMVCCLFFGIPHTVMEVLNEQICAVIISFTGRLYTLYLLADILRLLGIAGVSESMYQRNMSLMQSYLANQGVPDNLKNRIFGYCKFKFQGQYFEENEIRNTLSHKLRAELFLFTAREMIQKTQVFKNLPGPAIGSIMEVMKCETFSPTDIIITIGSEISEVYFISSGTVAVTNSAGYELCHLEDGDEFGTSCLFFKRQIYAVVAVETAVVFVINRNQFMEFLYPYPEVMNGFYRSAKEKLAKLKKLEDTVTARSINLLSQLERGNILEKRDKRLTADE